MNKSVSAGGALHVAPHPEESAVGAQHLTHVAAEQGPVPGPTRSPGIVQKCSNRIKAIIEARRTSGLAVAARWYLERLRQNFKLSPDSPWKVRPRQADLPLNVRRGPTSDLRVFEQIFVEDEYACLKDLADVRFLLDLGANVGFSSAWLLSAFPLARVLAVEPYRANFDALRLNLAEYGQRAQGVLGAAWSRNTRLRLSDSGVSEWAMRVEEACGEGDIEAYDIACLMKMAGAETVDLLKMDIEGAEAAIFAAPVGDWLPHVRNICVELHGPECDRVFFKALECFDYDLSRSGELTICRNLRPK